MTDKFNQYLIVSDMDGTFFGENSAILPNNLEAIRYFQENGGIFTLATGRDFRVLESHFSEAAASTSGPSILCNGAYLYDFREKKCYHELSLDQDEFIQTLQVIQRKYPEIGYRISCNLGFLCPNISPFLKRSLERVSDLVVEGDLSCYANISWHKCVFCAEPEIIKTLPDLLKDFPFVHNTITTSAPTLFEIIPSQAGKGKKLQELKKLYPGRIAICVGDYDNDIDMLEAADIAASPENALEKVKCISKIHLCHHRDGCIADLIYKLDSSIKE